jgi:hypothetical protein
MGLSRLTHWLPQGQTDPEVVQGAAQFHHQIEDPLLPQTEPIFDDATALVVYLQLADILSGSLRNRLRRLTQLVTSPPNRFSIPHLPCLACL